TVKDLKLEVSVDGGQNWILMWELAGDQGQQWFLEYIDLSAFEGLTVQFRFVGRKGFGSRGDIALDNLIFYGPEDGGFPPYAFYQDLDGDGYGNTDVAVYSCLNEAPAGYVAQDGDCWDLIPEFNPGVEETPCDFFDANCNGFADENFLPAPEVVGDTVCSGMPGVLEVSPTHDGFIVWYDLPFGGMPLDTGNVLVLAPLDNPSPDPIQATYYAEIQTTFGCYSPERAAVVLTVLPMPDLAIPVGQFEPECSGTLINLEQLVIQDQNNTNATYSFHSGMPPG
ncbi:MAG: hypothetical protein KDC44_19590, partial [Phaeodactylibacter sp.]|nr:hypothetical protein [Phaeodactylibacter sp.]